MLQIEYFWVFLVSFVLFVVGNMNGLNAYPYEPTVAANSVRAIGKARLHFRHLRG